MRRFVWSLVVGGLVSSGPGMGWAESPPTGATADPAAPTQYRRSLSDGASRKSYYTELLGSRTPAASVTEAERAPEAAPAAAPASEPPPRAGRFTLSHSPKAAKTPAATAPTALSAATPETVVHADYERQDGETERTKIHQVHATRGTSGGLTDPISIARPFPAESTATQTAALHPDVDPARKTITRPRRAPAPAPAPVPAAGRTLTPTRAPSASVAKTTEPAASQADAQTPAVTVEWKRKGEINVGQEFACDLIVKNTGNIAAQNVGVQAHLPKTVQLKGAQCAAPDQTGPAQDGTLRWQFAAIKPGEERVIHITMVPLQPGSITPHADVQLTGSATGQFEVSQPLLAIALDGPKEVMVGDSAAQTVSISNPGNGVATHVQLEALIPPGLEHVRGARLLMDLGALHPGETRSVRLPLAAVTGGEHLIQVQARADAELVQNAHCEVNVVAPKLTAAMDGPGLRYLGRQATYTVVIKNEGSVATDNVRVMHKVPEGFTLAKCGHGGQFDPNTRLVNWFVGRLERGQSAKVDVTFNCDEIGSFTHFVRATSEHGSICDGQCSTHVEGTPSLAMEVRDLDDPVEVGVETAYEIKVRNEGSAPAKTVNVSCELPAGLSLVDVAGPVEYIAERNLLVFKPLAKLDPEGTASFTIRVKGTATGNLRFRARLSSESIDEPLISEELTKFYGE